MFQVFCFHCYTLNSLFAGSLYSSPLGAYTPGSDGTNARIEHHHNIELIRHTSESYLLLSLAGFVRDKLLSYEDINIPLKSLCSSVFRPISTVSYHCSWKLQTKYMKHLLEFSLFHLLLLMY